jgi:hypothetical protein
MTFARGSVLSAPTMLAAPVLAALLAWACGGASSPVSPASPTPALPTPTPVTGDPPVETSSCPIGKGSVSAACQKLAPKLLDGVEAAIERLVREHPEIFDRSQEAGEGTGQYRVLAPEAYLDGVVANLRAAGLCAERTIDRERVVVKSTNDFSEEWDVLTSSGFVRRGRYSYVHTCRPASFPVAPQDLIAYVRTVFFSFECLPGVVVPDYRERRIPVGCDGFVTATPRTKDDERVPSWVHGPDVEWDLRQGADVVRVDPDFRFGNPFNKVVRPTGVVGSFVLCATVLGKEGCLNGQTIP